MGTVPCDKGVYHFKEVCGLFQNGIYQDPSVVKLCMYDGHELDMALADSQVILGVAKDPPPPELVPG